MRTIQEAETELGATRRNLVGEKIQDLRLHSRGAVVNQGDLAGEVVDAIMDVAPPTAPVRKRRRFSRSDIAKIEAGSRAVRDYELLAFAKVFGVPVQELLGLPADGMVQDGTGAAAKGGGLA